ncbi:MAG: hypothetical protein ABI944_03905 [Chthoniobacterales bacterium]
MKKFEKNAEMIFDEEEPIGSPTDLVMPRRRWFRRARQEVVASSQPKERGQS